MNSNNSLQILVPLTETINNRNSEENTTAAHNDPIFEVGSTSNSDESFDSTVVVTNQDTTYDPSTDCSFKSPNIYIKLRPSRR